MFNVRPLKPIPPGAKKPIRRLARGKIRVVAHATIRYVERVRSVSELDAEDEIIAAVGRAKRDAVEGVPRKIGVSYLCAAPDGTKFRAVLDAAFAEGGRTVITIMSEKGSS
jgi:hypothetical protein